MTDATPSLQRLDDQIDWYDKKSQHAQTWFKNLKLIQLISAANNYLPGDFQHSLLGQGGSGSRPGHPARGGTAAA
jgi:hypothetical protein